MATNMDRWHRADVVEAALHAQAVMDNPQRSEKLRSDAAAVFDMTKTVLLYQNDPHRHMVFVPAGFRVRNFYSDLVVELLARLPEDVKGDHPVYVTMAKQAAALTDNQEYSTDYRRDAFDALHGVVEVLEELGEDHRLEVVK